MVPVRLRVSLRVYARVSQGATWKDRSLPDIDLPKKKRAEVGLTYIYGIGRTTAREILTKAGVDVNTKISALTDDEVARIRGVITSDYKVEGSLRGEVQMNIKRLMDIGCYRGIRHRRGLPAKT